MSSWVQLKLLRNRFDNNIAALATRYPKIADALRAFSPLENYSVRPDGNLLHLGVGEPIRQLPQTLSPTAAQAVTAKMFPTGICDDPALIAGDDMGWLWNAVYQLPCGKKIAPGYRPPLFLLTKDVERLWAILHVQDWQVMLADARIQLFVGETALEDFRLSLHDRMMCPWPVLSVTIEPNFWPDGVSLDLIIKQASIKQNVDLLLISEKLQRFITHTTPRELAAKIRNGQPLKILGATSRYTTFIQYSMRDWLAGLERLGHQTKILIEEYDHEVPNNLAVAKICAEFKPDLIIAIDHCRLTLSGVPDDVPVVMWVQDRLEHIYDIKTGKAQNSKDYVIGYSRQELSQRFAYPPERFMPTMVGINDQRFQPRALSKTELDRYTCDISFVSHCVTPADQIIQDAKAKLHQPEARELIDSLFEQLRAVYDSGGSVTNGHELAQMVEHALAIRQITCDREAIMQLIAHKVNNALFRHQAVRWAAQSGVNLHLYGNGWENNPEFSKFARGVADNQDQLPLIYQASAINLQITPFGAVHQRLLDGLAAGGFFLLRSVTADELEVIRAQLWSWCQSHHIKSGKQMLLQCDGELDALLTQYQKVETLDPRLDIEYLYAGLDEAAINNFERTANTMWKQSPLVTFSNQQELTGRIAHFLANPQERREITAAMRQRVLETHTYQAISDRMLKFIATNIEKSGSHIALSAA